MTTSGQPETPGGTDREQGERIELRPGLVMIRRRTLKPDGRYLLYYDFERRGAGGSQETA